MNAPTAPSGLLEAALYVDDLDRAATFYGGLLGLAEVTRVPGRHLFYRVGEVMLLLFVAEKTRQPASNPALPVPPHGATGPGHICFRASDQQITNWANQFVAQKIAIEADFHWPNGARSLYVRDPFGNSIEFAEPRLWGFAA